MNVTVLGSGDAFCGAGRGHTSLLVEDGFGRLLVDAGGTTPQALARLGLTALDLDGVLLTHLHGDHFAGVAFLLLQNHALKRTRPFFLAGPVGLEHSVETLYRTLYASTAARERRYPITYRELEAGRSDDLGDRLVTAFPARHMAPPRVALSYRLDSDGQTVAFSGDSGPSETLAQVAAGAAVFFCECTRSAPGDADHLCVDDVERLRPGWMTQRVVLVHLTAEARAAATRLAGITVADDGLVVAVDATVVDGAA